MKQGTMTFGFAAVNAGQRNVANEPQVIATSTKGGFRLTPMVSKVLNLQHGEFVMFINNINNIDVAIAEKHAVVVEFCQQEGLDITTNEAAIAIHKAFDMWAIAKGVLEYDTKGNVKMTKERTTMADKVKFVSQNLQTILDSALADENLDAEVREALTREGVETKEQVEILAGFIESKEVEKYKGSKLANPAQLTGTGTVLNFTDSNVWEQLKVDLGDDADKINRVFDVDVDDLKDIEIYDGYKNVTVKALILGESKDEKPSPRVKKDQE